MTTYEPTPEDAAEWFTAMRAIYIERFDHSMTETGYDLDAASEFDANVRVIVTHPELIRRAENE